MTRSEALIPVFTTLLFATMPTRVFLLVASDVMQVAVLLAVSASAILGILAAYDINLGRKWELEVEQRLNARLERLLTTVTDLFKAGVALLFVTFTAKVFCLWFVGRGVPAYLLNHFLALCSGALAGAALNKAREAGGVVTYLATSILMRPPKV